MTRSRTSSFRTVMVPVVYGCRGRSAVQAAWLLNARVILVGLVPVAPHASLSSATHRARRIRRRIRTLVEAGRLRPRATVIVSKSPWSDLRRIAEESEPDLLILEWKEHFQALGIPPEDALVRPPCDIGLARGPFPVGPLRILVPVRGGPHAELALRAGLSMADRSISTLHLTPEDSSASRTDAPFRGLQRALAQMPEVEQRSMSTADPAETILREAQGHNLIILGTTAQPLRSSVFLGPVSERVIEESTAAVLAVRSQRTLARGVQGEVAGAHAISVLVDQWFAQNTYHADEFDDVRQLVAWKIQRGWRISLALPSRNEEATVGRVIRTIRRSLMEKVPLLDEIVLIDSNSTDRTREIARAEGVPVYLHQELLPDLGARVGKGEALWKSLLVTSGDILLWVDTDIVNIHPRFVYGILGPLLQNPRIQFVKGFYRRPLRVGEKTLAGGGGRVTELTARPLINLFYPELSGIVQPLSGEYGGRRAFLEQVPFFSGYGVETGLLIDAFERHGLSAIAQVDLVERIHHNQPLEALSMMSFVILQAFLRKLERRYGRPLVEEVNKSMKLIRQTAGVYHLDVEELSELERPPMIEIPEYMSRHAPRRKAQADSSPKAN